MIPATPASANHVVGGYYGTDSAGNPVELELVQAETGDYVSLYSPVYCDAGIGTGYVWISESGPTHPFGGQNQAGTFSLSGEFPSAGTVTGRVVLTDCGIDRTFQATWAAAPPPPEEFPPYVPPTVSGPPLIVAATEPDPCAEAKLRLRMAKRKLREAEGAAVERARKRVMNARRAMRTACGLD